MNNKLKLLTAEDIFEIEQILNKQDYASSLMGEDINNLIASKLKRGYTVELDPKNGGNFHWSQIPRDTHHIAYMTWPIVEEVKECEHELERTKMTRNSQEDGTVLIAHCCVMNKHCPNCGKKL